MDWLNHAHDNGENEFNKNKLQNDYKCGVWNLWDVPNIRLNGLLSVVQWQKVYNL